MMVMRREKAALRVEKWTEMSEHQVTRDESFQVWYLREETTQLALNFNQGQDTIAISVHSLYFVLNLFKTIENKLVGLLVPVVVFSVKYHWGIFLGVVCTVLANYSALCWQL